MTCDFEYKSESIPYQCQFRDETEFLPLDGKSWCRFHFPLYDENSTRTGKMAHRDGWEQGGAHRIAFEKRVLERINNALHGNPANLCGVVFPLEFNFSDIRSAFVDFEAAKFGGSVDISNASFGINSSFKKTTFEWTANFSGTKFVDGVSFSGAVFKKAAYFQGAKFQSLTDFSKATFSDDADFRHAKFGIHAKFTSATFGQNANFTHAEFGNDADFSLATIGSYANFCHSTFSDYPRFRGTKFGASVHFTGAKFGDFPDFTDATFGEDAGFSDTTFVNARFTNSSFGAGAKFNSAKLEGIYTGFVEATFGDNASFKDATFGDYTDFTSAEFLGDVKFSARKANNPDFDFHQMDFSKSKFFGPCSFENRVFSMKTSFNEAAFENLMEFHGCTFHQGMSFHKTEFLKTKGTTDALTEALERAYRTLKLGMETLRARNEEAMFFAREMECRRNRKDIGFFERFAATLYKNLSDYGRSMDLPLLWLLALANISFLVFGIVALATGIPDSVHFLGFTFEQMFRPFYVWSMSPVGTAPELVDPNPTLIPFIASLQSLATLSLLTLFLLALRRHFKMD